MSLEGKYSFTILERLKLLLGAALWLDSRPERGTVTFRKPSWVDWTPAPGQRLVEK